jgi:general secretion pathway protein L
VRGGGKAMNALQHFLSWWAAQLRDLVPARWRAAPSGPANALVLALHPEPGGAGLSVVVSERRNRREAERLRFSLAETGIAPAEPLLRQRRRDRPVVLRPPASWLLEREVTLPLAAADELGRVLAYEMDRFTPFQSDEVYWNVEVRSRDTGVGLVRLWLSVVPRALLLGLTAPLERVGAAPSALEFAGTGGTARVVRIERPPTRQQRRRRRVVLFEALACALLALATAAQPLVRQSVALDAVDARIAGLQPRVAKVEALRRRLANARDSADTIAREEARIGNPLRVLASLTELLPDDTYLTSFGLHDRTLTLEGQSAAAAKLIGGLSSDPLIQEPAFTAPVTRTRNGTDLFALRARIAP